MRYLRVLLSFLVVLASADCAGGNATDRWKLYEQKDFFSLGDRLPSPVAQESGDILFLRAATEAAFGQHSIAIADLQHLLAKKADRHFEVRARSLLMREERARFRYSAALAAIAPLLRSDPSKDDPDQADLRNSSLLLEALRDTPPEEIDGGPGPAAVHIDRDRRFPVTIAGHTENLGFDTGADFSFLAASVARKAGLRVKHVGISLGSSTGANTGADIAVGDVTIGSLRVRNVVFLILPDAGLTMPDGFFMPGLLGFPVMSALGPIRHDRDGSLQVGGPSVAARPNLALDGNHVLLRIAFKKKNLICRLDTGADNTVFYEPFYRRFPQLFGESSRKHLLELGGVSGAHGILAYKLVSMDFTIAGRSVHLDETNVMEKPMSRSEDNYLYCNVGMDAFKLFKFYTIDLKHLRLNIEHSD